MKRIFLIAWALMMTASVAFALSQSSIPSKFGVPWANGAGAAYVRAIPSTSQIGIQNCAASLPDGFPPLTFVPSGGGGCPPFGQDFNGILKQITQWSQWQSAGGPVFYDAAFSTAIGGYPNGARLASAVTPGTVWFNTTDNNSTNPDAGGAGWIQDPGQIQIGTPQQSLMTTIPTGYVSANGLTIGNAASNGTNRANADTQFLFAFVWNNCTNAICPIFTSGGGGTSRGATAAADFAANKAISVHNMNGGGVIGADSQNGTTTTQLVNVPVTSGSRTAPGSVLGENLHALTVAELAQHNHTDAGHSHGLSSGNIYRETSFFGVNTGGGFNTIVTDGTIVTITTGNANIQNTGSNTPHNTVSRSTVVYWNLKL